MNCYVRSIGVIDHQDKVHSVEFGRGVNVITGKSSTGKSAIIEIFDYCLGSSGFTVPDGVITTNAQLYFVVLAFPTTSLVLARKGNSTKAYIKEEESADTLASPDLLRRADFEEAYFIGLQEFKKELGRYFGLTMADTDEDAVSRRQYRGGKSPTPTVRSFMTFMLQHQNLVANKHALFYRFDEKEKREQTIEHLKVFLGYADQQYFLVSQKLNDLKADLRKIDQQMPVREEQQKLAANRIEQSLREYAAITGVTMVAESASVMLQNPARWLEQVRQAAVSVDGASDEFSKQSDELETERSKAVADLRLLERQLSSVRSSIRFAHEYNKKAQAVAIPKRAQISISACPFCQSNTNIIEHEANRLVEAIEWLNQELQRSPYLRESFEVDEKQLTDHIEDCRAEVRTIESKIAALDRQVAELQRLRPMNELAIKAIVRVESDLEDAVIRPTQSLLDERRALESQIAQLNEQQAKYQMNNRLEDAQTLVNASMADIGANFDFEQSYRPIKLRFSFDSFDLWHDAGGRKVFLRAMGSGANWLYCHLTLFMALHKLFCSLGDSCKIPPILFIDQPSQVYFPSFGVDNSREFDAKDLAQKAGTENRVDDDFRSVQNLYSELVRFCRKTLEETGIEPQIIVSDHADNLALSNGADFQSLVRARWRDRGFIHPLLGEQE